MGKKHNIFNKISAYYSGEEDRETLKRELENDPETKELFNWVNLIWNNLSPKPTTSGRIIQQRTYYKIEKINKPVFSFLSKTAKYAAVALLTLIIGSLAYLFSGRYVQVITVDTEVGEVREVKLPDGSEVWLNAQSSISYPERFNKKLREVTITGEVYFDVKKDDKHPFIVHSDLISVSVLGTSFMIDNYSNEPTAHAYLIKGKVELELKESKQIIELDIGDRVSYDKKTSVVTKTNNPGSVSVFDAWRFGKVSFYNESLYEIAKELERKFGKEIHIQDEAIGKMRYTADFDTKNLEQILIFFSELSGLEYKSVENGYLITKK